MSSCLLRRTIAGVSLIRMSSGAPGTPCPDGTSRLYPASFGWFYVLGYLSPGKDVGPLHCPGMDPFRNYGADRITMEEKWYQTYTWITADLARNDGTYAHPWAIWGGNWDCNPGGAWTSYFYRGWIRGTTGASSGTRPRENQWNSNEAMAVDHEWYDFIEPRTFFRSHGEGVNILFWSGAVFFGGRDINGYPPATYFSMTSHGYSYDSAITNGSSSGYPYAGQNGFEDLWRYYEEAW
jgi:hypothetical protein